MRVKYFLFILSFTLSVFTIGCVTIPITEKERIEYKQSIKKHPKQMIFYKEVLSILGRTPMFYKQIYHEGDVLGSWLKSRKDFSRPERFARWIKQKHLTRNELEIQIDIYK